MGKNETTQPIAQPQPAAVPIPHGIETAVVVPLLQNMGGGFAMSVLVSTVGTVLTAGGNDDPIAVFAGWFFWAGVVLGIVTFCLFTVFRAFKDDFLEIIAAIARGRAERVNVQTVQELAAAQRRIAELEKALREQGGERATDQYQTQNDAYTLLAMLNAGQSISREGAKAQGIGQQRWQRARALLINGGIFDEKGTVRTNDYGANVQRLTAYLARSHNQVLAENGSWYVA